MLGFASLIANLRPHSPFPIPHSPFPIPHSLFPIPYSPFPIPHSPFPIPYSPFPIPYSLFPIPYSPFPIPLSYRFAIGTHFWGSGPTYSARGRMMRLWARCSMMCAVQPVTRLSTKIGVNSLVGMPMK